MKYNQEHEDDEEDDDDDYMKNKINQYVKI